MISALLATASSLSVIGPGRDAAFAKQISASVAHTSVGTRAMSREAKGGTRQNACKGASEQDFHHPGRNQTLYLGFFCYAGIVPIIYLLLSHKISR